MKSASSVVRLSGVDSLNVSHNPKVAGSNPAPATISTCSERSPVSGDLFAFWAAPSIAAARFPQLDLEFALVRRQDNGVDEVTKRLRGFRPRSSRADCRRMRGVNYFCLLATTISAGERSANESRRRPPRARIVVVGRSLAVS